MSKNGFEHATKLIIYKKPSGNILLIEEKTNTFKEYDLFYDDLLIDDIASILKLDT